MNNQILSCKMATAKLVLFFGQENGMIHQGTEFDERDEGITAFMLSIRLEIGMIIGAKRNNKYMIGSGQ